MWDSLKKGTYDFPTICRVKDVVYGKPGHLDQVAYVTA